MSNQESLTKLPDWSDQVNKLELAQFPQFTVSKLLNPPGQVHSTHDYQDSELNSMH